jgi:hypothetical protein
MMPPSRHIATTTILLALLVCGPRGARAQGAAPVALSTCEGDTISRIDIRPHPPSPNGAAAEVWDAASGAVGMSHAVTRPELIFAYLKVDVGTICHDIDRSESERLLRAQPFIASASVRIIRDGPKRVRLRVDVVDEAPVVLSGTLRRGTIGSLSAGTINLDGRGLRLVGSYERGFDYRNGFGVRAVQYGAFGRPDFVAFTAQRDPRGDVLSLEVVEPFLTDLQTRAAHIGIRESSDYFGAVRPVGDDIALRVQRVGYDAALVWRVSMRGRAVAVLGGAVSGELVSTASDPVIVSDTGFLRLTPAAFDRTFASFSATRAGLIGGIRSVRFLTVRGFDALSAEQDVAIGTQIGGMVGPSVLASFKAGDVFASGDWYAGVGNARSFLAARIVAEARGNHQANRWEGVVSSGRLAWYVRPTAPELRTISLEYSGVQRLPFPAQLTFQDPSGGVRGYPDATWAGGLRTVLRLDDRHRLNWFSRRGDLAWSSFADVGKLWAGDVPFGRTSAVKGSVGVSLLGAYPAGGKRTYRLDLAVPLSWEKGRSHFELRFSSNDRTSMLWTEPRDVAAVRSMSVPSSIVKW